MHDAAYYIQILLSGVTVGSLYALIAIGYTMVYGILRLINFAHGDIFMMAGFFMVYAVTWMPLAVAIPLVLIATVALGVLIEKAAYSPLRTAPPSASATCCKTWPPTSPAVSPAPIPTSPS